MIPNNIPPRLLKLIKEIIKNEGGSRYTNDPKDRGGPTKYGVTAATLGHARKLKRDATIAEVKALKEDEAISIYYKQYVVRPNFDELHRSIQASVTDFGVNAGPLQAVRILQRMINEIEGQGTLTVDGMLGHNSITYLNKWCDSHGVLFLASFGYKKIDFYIKITNKNKDNLKWIRGWCNRSNKWIPKQYKFDTALLPNYVEGL
ncbi:MAG: N-acetylmuramidase [Gammaproteobacteria bacterium]|nr:N-acetylmuramidase [Gammaproteobacteria bacterium]